MLYEVITPGFILIFFTAGSWIVGLSLLVLDYSVAAQIVTFLVVSLILLFALRKYSIV